MIQAIETSYAGCRFRSRLEARWAVFFDHLGVEWEYEPQGYRVGAPGRRRSYLPDFWLPKSRTWVEVKGSVDEFDWQLLEDDMDFDYGLPGIADSVGTTRGLLLLGPVPRTWAMAMHHPILQHHEGMVINGARWMGGVLKVENWRLGNVERWVREMHRGWASRDLPSYSMAAEDAYQAARSARFEHGERG